MSRRARGAEASCRSLILSLLLACAALAGCDLDVPAMESASYEIYEKGSSSAPVELPPAQVQQLSAWLSTHRSGWSRTLVTHAPRVLLSARHADGETSGLNIWPSQVVASGRFGQYLRNLTPSEYAAIMTLVKPDAPGETL